MAARMSSSVSCGYSVRTSWWLMPLAKKSSNSETQMREPRMQGLPKHTLGSTEIRCSSGFITFSRSCADGARHVLRMRRNEPAVKRRPGTAAIEIVTRSSHDGSSDDEADADDHCADHDGDGDVVLDQLLLEIDLGSRLVEHFEGDEYNDESQRREDHGVEQRAAEGFGLLEIRDRRLCQSAAGGRQQGDGRHGDAGEFV